MRRSEQRLYTDETQILPNRFVCVAMCVMVFVILILIALNETGFFRVSAGIMRTGGLISIALLQLPVLIASAPRVIVNPACKYYLLGSISLAVLVLNSMLNIHAMLALVIPMLVGALYPSMRFCRISLLISLFCALVAPLAGLIFSQEQSGFYLWLATTYGSFSVTQETVSAVDNTRRILSILMYESLPHMLILLALYPLTRAIAANSEKRLTNQLQVLHMSESDALTGLLNRTRYEAQLQQPVTGNGTPVAVIYADANNLRKLNNEIGHAAGDALLVCVANALRDAFDDETVYRIGGDEFVVIVTGIKPDEVRRRLDAASAAISEQGYSISAGMETDLGPSILAPLVQAAEAKMMDAKARHHQTQRKESTP